MGESRTDVALNVLEISGTAWALTVHKAAEALAQEPDPVLSAYQDSIQAEAVRQLDTAALGVAEAELRQAGIVDGNGAITRQWVLAVWISAFGPVKVTAVVQSAGLSVHTQLAMAGGKGIGVTYARRISHGDEGVVVTEVRNAVEISFFAEEDAWVAINRNLPEVPEAADAVTQPGATASETVADARYTIHLGVSAHPAGPHAAGPHPPGPGPATARPATPGAPGNAPGSALAYASWDIWALADRLYSVGTSPSHDSSARTPVAPGDIRREFAWRLLGAREYLAGAAEQAA